jgi:hypothetical protein
MSFDAYGDESAGPDFVAYGTLLVPTESRADLESKIAQLKADHGVSATDDLHCRVLFSGDQRRKSVWAALTIADVFNLYSDLIAVVKPVVTRTIVTLANKKELPAVIPGGQWEAADPNFIGPTNWNAGFPFRDKQIAGFCAQGTMIPISKWPGIETVNFWPDPDGSLIEFYGGKRKVSQSLTAFIDHSPGKEPSKVKVSYLDSGKPVLLQVADLIAYVAQRSAGAKYGPMDLKFKALNKAIGAEQMRLGITPDGGIAFNIPNSMLELHAPNS